MFLISFSDGVEPLHPTISDSGKSQQKETFRGDSILKRIEDEYIESEKQWSMSYPSREELQQHVKAAIQQLLGQDAYLVEHDVNERAISHRLAFYLQNKLGDEWDVDCEYNRNYDDVKK